MLSQIWAAGPSAPSSPITERRSVEGEEAIDVGTTSEGKCAHPTHPYTSAAMDEPNWIFYDELESIAAAECNWVRQKPQRFIRAFRALHISRSSTRLSPSDPSHSASPRSLGAWRASRSHAPSAGPPCHALSPASTRSAAGRFVREGAFSGGKCRLSRRRPAVGPRCRISSLRSKILEA